MSTSASGGPPPLSGDGSGSPWARGSAGDVVAGDVVAGDVVAGDVAAPSGPVRPELPDVPVPPRTNSRTLLWFGIAGAGALAAGIVVILALASTGFFGADDRAGVGPLGPLPPKASKPPLATLCPPPRQDAETTEPVPPPDGPRVTDAAAGITYAQLGAPWKAWDKSTWSDGTLGVVFRQGYYIVTENYPGGEYLASVLSGSVPAAFGDSLTLDLDCAGRQVSDDVRNSYYPVPNKKEQVRDERRTLGGRPAWVSTFHLTFEADGLQARGETVAVVLVDVGRQDAAVLYLSIPDTHRQLVGDIEKVVASVRPL